MKKLIHECRWAWTLIASASLASAAFQARADQIIDSFDDDTTITAWSATWGTAPTLEWSNQDSTGNAKSGSLKVTADYFTPEADNWEQAVITRAFSPAVIGAEFVSVSVDVKIDDSSVATDAGQYGYFELKRTDGTAMGGVNLSSKAWTTISFPIAPTEGSLTGIIIQNGSSGFKGPVTYLLDNFRFNAPPPPKTVIDSFDDDTTIAAWSPTWGTSPVLSWSSEDANGSKTSGSLRVEADYFTPEADNWEQMVITRAFETPIVGSEYVSVSVDVKVDPESVPSLDNNYGYFELKRTDGTAMGGVNLTSTNWTRITFPIAATEGNLTGIIIQNGNSGFQGKIAYLLDNFVFTKSAGSETSPALSLTPSSTPGLRLYASAPGQAYQRQNIVYTPSEDIANNLWWVNQPDAMTYSVTWADFPGKANAGFQGHIMLVPDSSGAITPDWNDPNVILIEFQYANNVGADGTAGTADDSVMARARFLHKVNEAAGNGMLYRTAENAAAGPVGVLGEIWAPSMIGTWSVSLKHNTDGTTTATLSGPGNVSESVTIIAEEASSYEPFGKGVTALVGVQPNADTRVGLAAIVSNIKITKGNTTVVNDAFTTAELDPAVWTVRAQDPGGIVATTPDLAFVVSWPLPDGGFSLRGTPGLPGTWTPFTNTRLVGARRVVLVNKSDLPGSNSGFFQLVK